jgi:curli biogenesis system outer membrane secretion channel CsgG
MRIADSFRVALIGAAGASLALGIAPSASAESAYDKQQRKEAEIPTCSHQIGTLAVHEPENKWWEPLGLESPEALLKVFVQHSHCFRLLDRGKGFAAVQQERELASGGELQQGSNMGKGQILAADYVLVPDIVSKNTNAGGTNVGGILGGFVGGGAGAILSGINIQRQTADVVLTITNVRTTEQQAMEEGHSSKSDLGFGVAGGWGNFGGGGGLGITNYQSTEIGQVVTLAYIDAYTKLVGDMGGLSAVAAASTPDQSVTMMKPGHLYARPSPTSHVIRSLSVGMMLYPTGDKTGVWWEVKDEIGDQGWVSSLLLQLAK